MDRRVGVGKAGEDRVARHMVDKGFQIVGRNVRVGRLEIDIIARRGGTIVICEVRTRSSARFAEPVVTIDRAKQARLRNAGARWMRDQKLFGRMAIRFDAAAVVLDEDRLDYYEAAF